MPHITQDSWKMFNQISSTYDRINRILSLGMDHGWRKKVAQNLPAKKNLRILDLATGTGDQLISLVENGVSIQKASTSLPPQTFQEAESPFHTGIIPFQ